MKFKFHKFKFMKLNFRIFKAVIMFTKIFTIYTLTLLLFLLDSFHSESVDVSIILILIFPEIGKCHDHYFRSENCGELRLVQEDPVIG